MRKGNRVDGLMYAIYDAFAPLALAVTMVISLFNLKLRNTLRGKKGGVKGWKIATPSDAPLILLHVASAGEFESAKPLIDQFIQLGKVKLAVSYSSPSAEKPVAATEGLYAYGFLPHDFLLSQLRLIDRLKPDLVLIFKHDFWPNFLRGLSLTGVPVGLVNANFHERSLRSLPIISCFHKTFMKNLDFVWAVSQADLHRIKPVISTSTELKVGGDTRYDRVLLRAKEGKIAFQNLRKSFGDSSLIVAGSTWQPDEQIIWQAFAAIHKLHSDVRLIIAPHEPVRSALERNRYYAAEYGLKTLLYSEWQGELISEDVLIIDRTRILAGLYSVGWAAYVGGGFGVGVHSVIEPAACSLPVMFGPNHHVSHEASLLIAASGGFEMRDAAQIQKTWSEWLTNYDRYTKASDAALSVVNYNAGAVNVLLTKVDSYLNLELD